MKDLFLCHGGADKAWVRELGARLEAETVGNRQVEVFFDEWDIDHGENIVSKIDQGLKEARFVAVVLSPAMLPFLREFPMNQRNAGTPRRADAKERNAPNVIPEIAKPIAKPIE